MMGDSYIRRLSGQTGPETILLYGILLIAFLILVGVLIDPTFAFAGAFAVGVALSVSWRPQFIPALFLAYLCIFPASHSMDTQGFYPVHYYPQLSLVFLPGMALLLQLNRGVSVLHPLGVDTYRRRRTISDPVSVLLNLLMLWFAFMVIWGLANDADQKLVLFELSHVIIIAGYYIWVTLFRRYGNLLRWFHFFIGVGLVAGIGFLLFLTSNWDDIIRFVLYRLLARQNNLVLVSIPLIMTFLLASKRWWPRIGWASLLFFAFVQTFAAQTRSLWLDVILICIMFFSLYAFRNGFTKRGFKIWFIGVGIVILFATILLLTVTSMFNVDLGIIFKRWEDLGSLQDASTMLRVFDLRRGMQSFLFSPFLGHGLGVPMFTVPNASLFQFIDNSYVHALHKGGLPYLLLLAGIYLSGLYRSWQIYRQSDDDQLSIFGAAFISSIIALLLMGNVSVILTNYRLGFLWMMVLAAAQVMYENWRMEADGKRGTGAR